LRALLDANDLVRIGMLADQVRRRRHGIAATFVRVAQVRLADAASATWPAAAGEVCLVGTPASAEEAVEVAGALVGRAGAVPVTAWSLDDLERLACSDAGLTSLVRHLVAAGVSAIAEAPIDRLADPVGAVTAVTKAGGALARPGVDRIADRDAAFAVLQLVKRVQKATGAIRSFAPLPRLVDERAPSTGYDDVKLVALARLYLDNVPSIQVDWQRYGPKLAQVALLFGADDIDGVSPLDEIDLGRRRAPLEEVRRNITAASLSPVERDGRWGIVAE
jgi:aminodeoxyfutalosine synthase